MGSANSHQLNRKGKSIAILYVGDDLAKSVCAVHGANDAGKAEQFTVRTVMLNSKPWFVAADVCAALELGNVTMALARLDADEQALISTEARTPTGGAVQ